LVGRYVRIGPLRWQYERTQERRLQKQGGSLGQLLQQLGLFIWRLRPYYAKRQFSVLPKRLVLLLCMDFGGLQSQYLGLQGQARPLIFCPKSMTLLIE
jgi:hypothetical protein